MLAHIHDHLAAQGCVFPDIDLLQPADPFLDTTGEDLRRRIFMTQETSGKSWCLRPEFTIPVCLHHLEKTGAQARYAYGGKVFRQRSTGPAEFVQAGFEDIGNLDHSKADADCIRIALEMLNPVTGAAMQTIVGDQSVFVSLLDALEIPPAWRKKLLRAFGDQALLKAQLDRIDGNGPENNSLPQNLLAALQSGDSESVLQLVAERMEEDGLPLTGGRTPQAISDRLIEHYQLRSTELPLKARTALDAYLKIETPLASAVTELRKFEDSHDVSLPQAADKLASLEEGLGEHTDQCIYRARFGRRLDYYTGLVFEIYREGSALPLVGGGRYDMLMTLLGASQEMPAVGFAVWVDRLEGSS